MNTEEVKTDVEAAKQKALAVVNAEANWIQKHPAVTGWVVCGLMMVVIILALKSCA